MEKLEVIFNKVKSELNNKEEIEQFYQNMLSFYETQHNENNKKNIIQTITDDFISNNMIFYNKTSKIYYNYTNNNYLLLNEDNMIHHISIFITNYKDYRNIIDLSLKNLTKQSILRCIKDNPIYDTIPDEDTIQEVLGILVPTFFESKEYAKIFLLSIGTILLKKQSQKTIIFMKSNTKPFLNEINKYISMYFCNNNVFNYFKFKYTSDHNQYDKYIIPSKSICYEAIHFKEQFYINLICVSIYYSNRYNNIEKYLESVIGDISQINNKVQYFQENNKESTIHQFKCDYMIEKSDGFIEQNDLLFLWKQYIQKNDLFVHVFTSYSDFLNSLFIQFNQTYEESNICNKLNGYYSMEIPTIHLFRQFWDEHFTFCEDECYFEISEILHLFHDKHKQKKTNISESSIYMIIQLYYSNFDVVKEKIVHNLKCNLWDKKKEINLFIEKEKINIKVNVHTLYKKYSMSQDKLKINKKYFSMYIDQLRNKCLKK